MTEKRIILSDIKILLLDFKRLYGNSNLKIVFNIPGQCETPEKIKVEITETV